MTKEEIKVRLAGYRPEIYEDHDPQIARALLLARADPELSDWLDDQIAFDRQFAAALGKGAPDQGELEKVLVAADDQQSRGPQRRSLRGPILAAAAVLLLGAFAVKFFFFPPAVQFPDLPTATASVFRDQMAYYANQRFALDESISDLEKARDWLSKHKLPVYSQTPGTIAGFEGIGCKAIDWHGTKVALVCFLNEDRDIVHLFIIESSALTEEGRAGLAELKRQRNLETQGWQDESHVYVFVGADPGVSLNGLL